MASSSLRPDDVNVSPPTHGLVPIRSKTAGPVDTDEALALALLDPGKDETDNDERGTPRSADDVVVAVVLLPNGADGEDALAGPGPGPDDADLPPAMLLDDVRVFLPPLRNEELIF